jgi:hypothetical protein
MATKDWGENKSTQARKLWAITLFRNVLPECNLVLGSQLTAASAHIRNRALALAQNWRSSVWKV